MARRGLYRRVDAPFGPIQSDAWARAQDSARDAVEQLSQDDDLVQSPAVSMAATDNIPTGATVVVYRGGPSQTLSMPLAAARGPNTAYVLHVINAASVAVTLARAGVDTINAGTSLSLSAGKLAVCVSDGLGLWKAVIS